jgi:lipoprotein-anchoring transpeptidase ErfK/SrfK
VAARRGPNTLASMESLVKTPALRQYDIVRRSPPIPGLPTSSRKFPILLSVAAATAIVNVPARAGVIIAVDKSSQLMSVSVDGVARHRWAVSTARAGYSTPNGTYRPERLERTWFSREYYNSPMPYSIFFHNGYAIHGSYEISRLGGPASHGCVRLRPSNAATLFALVNREGTDATMIVVSGQGAGGGQRR